MNSSSVIRVIGVSVLAVLLPLASSRAGMVIGYDAADTAGSLSPIFDIATAGVNLSRSSGLSAQGGGGNDYNSSSWDSGDALVFGFTTVPSPVDLTTLTFSALRSGTGPSSISLEVDIGGGFIVTDSPKTVGTSATSLSFDLSAFTSVSSANFRITGVGSSSAGTFRIRETGNGADADLLVNGNLAAIPELNSFTLGLFVLSGIGVAQTSRTRARRAQLAVK